MLSDPLPPGFLAVIETICTTLRLHNILWVLTGSASFALQGMQLPIKDIDLQTDAVGAYKIEAVLAEAENVMRFCVNEQGGAELPLFVHIVQGSKA